MFDIGFQEMVVIGVLALLVFGPSNLPELGRMVGRALRQFRRASDEFRSTVETNLNMNEPYSAPGTAPAATPADAGAATSEMAAEMAPSDGVESPGETAAVATAPAAEWHASEPYCAQRGSRLFHRRECAWVERIPEAERVPLKSVADARDAGFATCPVCEPWEPGG